MDIETVIEISATHGPHRVLTNPCIPTWPAELADAFAQIEGHDRRVGFVFVHTDHRYRFAEATKDVLSSVQWGKEEAQMGTLWGAEVWFTPHIPKDTVLLVADEDYLEPDRPIPGTILSITSSQRLFP